MNRADLINRLANKPGIREFVAGDYRNVDLSAFAADPKNLVYGDLDGVVLFVWLGPGAYGMHYMLTRKRRGKKALAFCRRVIADVFTHHEGLAIVGSTPATNLPARIMNTALGGRPVGVSVDSLGRSCIDYVLERERWEALSGASSAGLAVLLAEAPKKPPTTRQPNKPSQATTI